MEQDLKKISTYFHGLDVPGIAHTLQRNALAEGDSLELEFRIGETTVSRGRSLFNPSLTEREYTKILEKLSKAKGMQKSEMRSESICFDSTKSRCEDGLWNVKEKLADATSSNVTRPQGTNIKLRAPDVRIAMSRETIIPTPVAVPAGKRVTRIKERTSFTYKMWRFDITKVTQDGEVKYEAEIELVPNAEVLLMIKKDVKYATYIITYGLLLSCDLADMMRL